LSERNNILEAANAYVRLGFNIIPLVYGQKTPALKELEPYFSQRSTENEMVAWFGNGGSGHNIGIVTGAISQLIVIDIDGQTSQSVFMSMLEKVPSLRDKLARTMGVTSGKGKHFYLRTEPSEFPPGVDTTVLYNGEGGEIRVKGNRGYIVAPPSVHPSGKLYESNGKELQSITADEWRQLLAAFGTSEAAKRPIEGLFAPEYRVKAGNNRHEDLLRVMESLIARNHSILSEKEISKIAYKWNQEHCEPPLSDEEFERQWHDAVWFIARMRGQGKQQDAILRDIEHQKRVAETADLERTEGKYALIKHDDVTFCCNVILKEAKEENLITKQLVYTMLSAYTNNPVNLAINAPTGTGKTHAIMKAVELFPKTDVVLLVGMTDKALFHRQGVLVIQNEETGEYENIQPQIDKLDLEIQKKDMELLSTTTRESKADLKKEQALLEKEKAALLRNAKKLIDLSHKILVFLDTPSTNLFAAMMPLLSHDAWEVEYDFVDTHNGIKTRSNVLRGWPAVIFAQAIDSSHHTRWPEIQRRFIITNPQQTDTKIKSAIELSSAKYGLPDALYQKLVVADQEKKRAQEIILGLKDEILRASMSCKPGRNNVYVPYRKAVEQAFPSTQAMDMTTANRFFTWLSLMPLVRIKHRPVLRLEDSPAMIPLATFADLKETLSLVEYINGVRPYVLEWFNDLFLTAHAEIVAQNIERLANLPDDEKKKEKRDPAVGITSKELALWLKGKKAKSMTRKYIREAYLEPLFNAGYLEKEENPDDKREALYSPVVEKQGKLFGEQKIIPVKDFKLYPGEDNLAAWIEEDVGAGIIVEPSDNIAISPRELVQKYYSDPSECFEAPPK
jgi:hypothetical protein